MRVTALWHYPIKSTLGEAVPRLEMNERGAVGDRLYAIADAADKLGSGKTTERFTRIDKLLALRAKMKNGTVQVVFPDGREINIGSNHLDDELSGFLGQQVTLRREQAIPHHDDSAVHLLLSSELDGLQTLLPDAVVDPRRFRANMLLQTPAGMTGGGLVDTVLTLGSVRLQVTHKTERCRMVTLAQEDFGYDPGVLRTIVQEFDVDFGIYAKVLKPGSVQVGDAVDMAPGPRTDFRGNALGI